MSAHTCGWDCAYGAECRGWSVMVYDGVRENWIRIGGMTEDEAREEFQQAMRHGEAVDLKNDAGNVQDQYRPIEIRKATA